MSAGDPYYPIQTPDQLPSGLDFQTFADGRRGFIVRASSGNEPYFVTQRIAPPSPSSFAVLVRCQARNYVAAADNGYEGIGVRVYLIARDGSTQNAVVRYDNDPVQKVDRDNWYHERPPEVTTITQVIQWPEGTVADHIIIQWMARGSSGHAELSDFEVRPHYQRVYRNRMNPTNIDTWFQKTLYNVFAGRTITGYNRELTAHNVKISAGRPLTVSMSMFVKSAQAQNLGGNSRPFYLLFLLRMRRRDGTEDWIGTNRFAPGGHTPDRGIMIDYPFEVSQTRIAEYAYVLIQPMLFLLTDAAGPKYVDHDGINVEVRVDDSAESGST